MTNKTEPVYHLTPNLFIQMLKAGAKKILAKESKINDLNVFPVNDHDTGTNIGGLMRFLLASHYPNNSFSNLFKHVADSSLIGAAGNSGIIFSAFFSGLALDKTLHGTTLSAKEFLQCIRAGVKEAYKAVANPVEGTVLTVMRTWTAAFGEQIEKVQDYIELFDSSIRQAEDALKETEHQLPVLERSHVVDAGAYAFLLMLKGMFDCLQKSDEHEVEVIEEETYADQPMEHSHEIHSNHQYCFESILLTKSDPNAIRTALVGLGDSMVINRSPSFMKIHIHTDQPKDVTVELKKFGSIQSQKIDDMQKQFAITHQRKHRIALVTDSSADLPQDFIDANQIHVIPIQMRIGEHALLDGLTVDLEQVYEAINEEDKKATTAAPSPEIAYRYLSYLASRYESVIAITIASQMSGVHQLMSQQAKKIGPNVTIIDSRKNSVAHGLLVMKAAELIASGCSHNEIVKKIDTLADNTNIFLAVNDFKTIAKSGRVPKSMGLIAGLAHFKPIMTLNAIGKSGVAAIAFGTTMSEKRLLGVLKKYMNLKCNYRVAIVHSLAADKAEKFAKLLKDKLGLTPIYIKETSCAVGLHAGKGCIAVGVLGESKE